MIRIEYLARFPHLTPVVARWLHREWLGPTGASLERAERIVRGRLNCDGVPLMLVALDGRGRAVGTASLITDAAPDGSEVDCLAGVYVRSAWRRRGVGTLLCWRAVFEALYLGLPTLCLYTRNHEAYYARRGWRRAAVPDDGPAPACAVFMEPASSLETLFAELPFAAPEPDSRSLLPEATFGEMQSPRACRGPARQAGPTLETKPDLFTST